MGRIGGHGFADLFKGEGPPAEADGPSIACLRAHEGDRERLRRSLCGADPIGSQDPGRSLYEPQVMTMRHWITSFRLALRRSSIHESEPYR